MPVELRSEATDKASLGRSENSRKFETLILRKIADIKQVEVAKRLDASETLVSRIISGERRLKLDEIYDFLAAIDFSIIERDGEGVTLTEAEYEALRTLARKGLDDDRRNRRPA